MLLFEIMPENNVEGQPSVEIPVSKATQETKPKETGPSLLSYQEYRNRRSPTLLENPNAELNEQNEIQKYFERQSPEHVEEIKKLVKLDKPMNNNCRMVITIPAYNEGTRIKNTLEQFAHQDIDPSLFEIVVFANPAENDITEAEIAKFKEENPPISVISVTKPWNEEESKTVGNARKYAADIAMARILHRGPTDKDTLLITNDADTVKIDHDYLRKILAEFDEDPTKDALVTNLGIPQETMNKPNVAAGFALLNTFEKVYATGDIGEDQEKIPEPALTNGRSSAIRSAMYAAVGGFNPDAVITEDWELGWMIADARDWNEERITYYDQTELITDPRRLLNAIVSRVPVDQQLLDFQTKPELREQNNQELLSQIPDSFDWELFQDDIASLWKSQEVGSNKRIGKKRFALLFKATMDTLGVTYRITEDDEAALVNADKLLEKLAGPGRHIEIIHSEPRVYTPDLSTKIRGFFSGLPVGVLGSRAAKADRIAAEINSAQISGESDKIPGLIKVYERFADHEYTPPPHTEIGSN